MNTTIQTHESDRPTLSLITSGSALKVFNVTGKSGMSMPPHHTTLEAVITVKSGKANLILEDAEVRLTVGSTFLIPAGNTHSLTILEDFQATVVMLLASEIKFDPVN